ncbi:hypothetical protein D3C77_650660 [compost metagenome]
METLELICSWPETWPMGRRISLNCELGTDSALIRSSEVCAAAIPLEPKNRLSPYSWVKRPALVLRFMSAGVKLP